MTRSTGQRKPHFKDIQPADPAVKRLSEWPPANRAFYVRFRDWLRAGGYGDSALHLYGCAARLALGWLDVPHWEIDPQADLDRVREYMAARYDSEATRSSYAKGLVKLAEYLRLQRRQPGAEKPICWATYLDTLPCWLHDDIRAYVAHRRRAWLPETRYRSTLTLLSQLTLSLRWMAAHTPLHSAEAITPALWFDYVDERLAEGRSPSTLNTHLCALQDFLRFLAEQERTICSRTLRVPPLDDGPRLPRDVPIEQIRRLFEQIEAEAASPRAETRRLGRMDLAWALLMLHSGLRRGEVRRLLQADIDLDGRRVRIVQSKGLKDRVVYLTPATVDALRAYLEVRGTAASEHVFIYRHQPLSHSYCWARLRTYSRRGGVDVTPHQLRHCCATFLLNAGAPILTVQALLGHKHVDTTLEYARLYDGTVAADYYRAMGEVEKHLALPEETADPALDAQQLLALLDSLRAGTLNDAQRDTIQMLRAGILALAESVIASPDGSAVVEGRGGPVAAVV